MSSENILKFFGYEHPLSNFYEASFRIGDIIYPSVEHFFQASKTDSFQEKMEIVLADTPSEAKKLGKYIEYLRDNWDIKRNVYMYRGILAKFLQNEDLKQILIRTGDKELIEDNIYDSYWGCGKDGKGRNMTGKILMKVRSEIKE